MTFRKSGYSGLYLLVYLKVFLTIYYIREKFLKSWSYFLFLLKEWICWNPDISSIIYVSICEVYWGTCHGSMKWLSVDIISSNNSIVFCFRLIVSNVENIKKYNQYKCMGGWNNKRRYLPTNKFTWQCKPRHAPAKLLTMIVLHAICLRKAKANLVYWTIRTSSPAF